MKPPRYPIPQEVAAALSTGRPELVEMLVPRTAEGVGLTAHQQAGLLQLVADLVREQDRLLRDVATLERTLDDVTDNARGVVNKLEEAIDKASAIRRAKRGES